MAIKPWDPGSGIWPGGVDHFADGGNKKPPLASGATVKKTDTPAGSKDMDKREPPKTKGY